MIVILDLETRELARHDRTAMRVSVAGVRCDGTCLFFSEEGLQRLFELLDGARLIVGYNIIGFDYAVLQRYASFDVCARYREKTYDIMRAFEVATGRLVKLNDLALRTLGIGKSGDGKDAPALFAQGKLEELKAYLAQDLHVTEQLFLHIQAGRPVKYGHIAYKEPVERSVLLPLR